MPELLSPAGTFEKLKAAIRYGADAVYLAGRSFGMRSAADNFTDDELFVADGPVEQEVYACFVDRLDIRLVEKLMVAVTVIGGRDFGKGA